MPLTNIVVQNLYALRIQRKLSQAAVAKAAGFSVSYISMLERASDPRRWRCWKRWRKRFGSRR
jgi:hypothetical protein